MQLLHELRAPCQTAQFVVSAINDIAPMAVQVPPVDCAAAVCLLLLPLWTACSSRPSKQRPSTEQGLQPSLDLTQPLEPFTVTQDNLVRAVATLGGSCMARASLLVSRVVGALMLRWDSSAESGSIANAMLQLLHEISDSMSAQSVASSQRAAP